MSTKPNVHTLLPFDKFFFVTPDLHRKLLENCLLVVFHVISNNDIFTPCHEAARVENKSLFLMKAAMNFVRERRNGRKRYSHDFEYQKL